MYHGSLNMIVEWQTGPKACLASKQNPVHRKHDHLDFQRRPLAPCDAERYLNQMV
jgi:hypothetical protein